MLKLIDKETNILGDNIGYIELWDASECNLNKHTRKQCVAQIATLSYGNKTARDPDRLWDILYKKGHLSVFEFIRYPMLSNDVPVFCGIEWSLRNVWDLPTYEDISVDIESDIDAFNRGVVLIKVKMPIFVARHFVRHRISRLEMSRRYTKPTKVEFEFYTNGKDTEFDDISQYSLSLYRSLVDRGIRHELARTILPQTLYTEEWEMYDWKQLGNFLELRTHKTAQEETRKYAIAIKSILENNNHKIIKTINKYWRNNE